MIKYNPAKIEKKWQKYWEQKKMHATKDKVKGKENFYLLFEFPYPSGNLHIGHWYAFSVPDILSRYLRMKGYNVMYPVGFDAFGLPAENAAIEHNLQPKDWTDKNIAYMSKQLKSMGATFDWSREVRTTDPEYYKWTQWIFLQFYKKGLAYRAQTSVNWCPRDKTVLANEQVVNGKCERCGESVVQKEIAQWMLRITNYADRLLEGLKKVDWPETTKTAQENWIGRSEGAEIEFLILPILSESKIQKQNRGSSISGQIRNLEEIGTNSKETIKVFTTRADTLFGATYLVLAPEHPMVLKLTTDENLDKVNKYLEEARKKSEMDRLHLEKEKTGVFTGAYAVNPINNERIPIWIADYVIGWYGSGAVMAVPAHDQRDHDFATKYSLPVKTVVAAKSVKNQKSKIKNQNDKSKTETNEAYEGEGILVDSGEFTGFKSEDAREEIVEKLAEKKLACRKINYRLHDWVISRQRYWGVPIPMIHCGKCGYQPVSEKELPIKLPKLDDYKPTSDGRSPLAKAKEWVKTKCPHCGREAERETDTMDTFVDSSWYFLRYTDPKNKKVFASPAKMHQWLPVDLYVGGAEHNTMHLLYSRFFTKALFDLGLIDFDPVRNSPPRRPLGRASAGAISNGVDEPFIVRKNHGVILGADGQKMSKSRGNVVDPDELVKKYGADTVRMYLAFMGPYDQGGPWNPGGTMGVYRFLNRVWALAQSQKSKTENSLKSVLHKAIKKIGGDIAGFKFNTAVSELMKLLNEFESREADRKSFELLLRLLAPLAPHLAEEIWVNVLGHKKSIHLEKWPDYDKKLIAKELVSVVVQVNGRARGIISLPADSGEEEVKKLALADEKAKKHLAGCKIKRVVFVKNRLINFVI
jgi:leucyl-tRNA synthetase